MGATKTEEEQNKSGRDMKGVSDIRATHYNIIREPPIHGGHVSGAL